uniref:Uncharacterized protein n=1 Tax=Echinococcus canadensis TaxID=519352 RepID=A0A915F0B7_9CEST
MGEDRICRPADQMAMNSSGACYRRITEDEIIDQTLPLAKTIRDKGQFSPLEYIGVPSPLLNEIPGDTITERSVTPRESKDQSVDEEFGGPSLLFSEVLIPLLVKDGTNSYKIISNPQPQTRILFINNRTEVLVYQWKGPPFALTDDKSRKSKEMHSWEFCLSETRLSSFSLAMVKSFVANQKPSTFPFNPPLKEYSQNPGSCSQILRCFPPLSPITLHLCGIAFWPDSRLNGGSKVVAKVRAVYYL